MLQQFFVKQRILASWVMALIFGVFILFIRDWWPEDGIVDALLESLGLIFVAISAFGRLWSLMYVSGYKTKNLIVEGPYSMVRNPLYFFSFIGAIGIGFSTESIVITILIAACFLAYYPSVVLSEEKKLLARHGQQYRDYVNRTPSFIPNPFLLSEPETYTVNARLYRKAFWHAMFFIWMYGLIQLIEKLHNIGILPTLVQIP